MSAPQKSQESEVEESEVAERRFIDEVDLRQISVDQKRSENGMQHSMYIVLFYGYSI